MRTWVVAFGALIVVLTAPPSGGNGISFTFTTIADDQGMFNGFPVDSVAVNNGGTVVFRASLDAGGEGIFVGRGGPLTTVVQVPSPPDGLFGLGAPSMNDAGTVAFTAAVPFSPEPSRVLTGSGGPLTTIATAGVNGFPFGPSISNRGTVALSRSAPPGGITGVFTGDGGPLTTIATSSSPEFFTSPAINNAGTVAFKVVGFGPAGLESRIFIGRGGPLTPIADTTGLLFDLGDPAINNSGTIAFRATYRTNGVNTILVANADVLTPIVDSTGPFFSFFEVAINDSGTVAFSALLRGGTAGIFTGPDSVADKVIAQGDPLLDSTVFGPPFFFTGGFNNRGQIVFGAELTNGKRGIFLATPVARGHRN